jgi:hypothetical protein
MECTMYPTLPLHYYSDADKETLRSFIKECVKDALKEVADETLDKWGIENRRLSESFFDEAVESSFNDLSTQEDNAPCSINS